MIEIYSLKDPISGEIRYIGKAVDSQKRLLTHIRDAKRRNTPVYQWIRQLLLMGLMPMVDVINIVKKEDWQEAEMQLILFFKDKCELLNIAKGGNEPYCDIETRRKNGRKVAQTIHSNHRKKRMWYLKKQLAHTLIFLRENGRTEAANDILVRLQYNNIYLKNHGSTRRKSVCFG